MKRIFHNYRHCGSEARQKPSWTAMVLHVSGILSGQKGAHTASKSTLSTTGRGYTRRPQSNIFIAMFDSFLTVTMTHASFSTKNIKRQPIKGLQCRRLRRASVQSSTAKLQHHCPAACCLQGSTELNDVGMHQARPSLCFAGS